MMMFRGMLLIGVIVTLAACQVTVTVPYNPVGTAEINGQIKVADFVYQPPEGTAPNQLPNTAAGKIFMTDPISEWVTKAVRRELRLAGLSARGERICTLEGVINEFSIDDLGFDVDYMSNIDYALRGPDNSELLDKNVAIAFEGPKFLETSVFASISKMVSDSIDQVLSDPDFIAIAESDCNN